MPKDLEVNYSRLLHEAITKEGKLMEAYHAFHNFSLCNRILAMIQLIQRGKDITPIKTFNQWKNDFNRSVNRGEHALELCMPIQKTWYRYVKDHKIIASSTPKEQINKMLASGEIEKFTYKDFVLKRYWFALSQTSGEAFNIENINIGFDKEKALKILDIKEVPFESLNGNCQGYATYNNEIAINPLAQLPFKTLFHELGHIVLGHTNKEVLADNEELTKNIIEVEAEATALLCLESLGMNGSEFCRGYIQSWLGNNELTEKSAQRIISAADKILKAGA